MLLGIVAIGVAIIAAHGLFLWFGKWKGVAEVREGFKDFYLVLCHGQSIATSLGSQVIGTMKGRLPRIATAGR